MKVLRSQSLLLFHHDHDRFLAAMPHQPVYRIDRPATRQPIRLVSASRNRRRWKVMVGGGVRAGHQTAGETLPHQGGSAPRQLEPGQLEQQDLSLLQTAHHQDLADRLRAWANDLDAREAQLNARIAIQDRRERQFRMLQMDAEAELAEQRRKIDQICSAVQAQARRLAFESR